MCVVCVELKLAGIPLLAHPPEKLVRFFALTHRCTPQNTMVVMLVMLLAPAQSSCSSRGWIRGGMWRKFVAFSLCGANALNAVHCNSFSSLYRSGMRYTVLIVCVDRNNAVIFMLYSSYT